MSFASGAHPEAQRRMTCDEVAGALDTIGRMGRDQALGDPESMSAMLMCGQEALVRVGPATGDRHG